MSIDIHGHSEHHHHDHGHSLAKHSLRIAFFLTAIILVVELIGGFLANSLALVSDAAHVVTDLVALGLAWFAAEQAERPSNERKTFGYHRVGILAALLNAVTLIVVTVAICWEAILRLQHPQSVQPLIMFGSALVGIAINLFIGFSMRQAGENLNVRAAMLHVFGDVAVSLGVIVAGVIILLTHWTAVDPLLSIAVALLIAIGTWHILHETINILLEAVPKGISLGSLVQDMKDVHGVKDVHDLHVWSIASGMNALSCHILIDNLPMSMSSSIRQALTRVLDKKYHISHSTIQFECDANSEACCEKSSLYCQLTPKKQGLQHAHHHEHLTPVE